MSVQTVKYGPEARSLAIMSNTENIKAIMQSAPDIFEKNRISHDRCLAACNSLLRTILAQGMTDELDQQAASLLEKTRNTFNGMNKRRSPITKLFDQARKEFTSQENDIDAAKQGTVPYQLQALRNKFAKQKHEEEERRRQEEFAKQQAQATLKKYSTDCIEDLKAQFNRYVTYAINAITQINSLCTLDTYDSTVRMIESQRTELPEHWKPAINVSIPMNLNKEEASKIWSDALDSLMPQFKDQYRFEIGNYKQEILDRLPSKKMELERAAQASAEEKAKIEAELKAKEQAELARKEQERIAREKEEAARAEAQKASAEAKDLFSLAATTSAYQPKTKVTKKIEIASPDGYLKVFMMWWAKEGCTLPQEQLAKKFKTYVTFCENLANRNGETINDPAVRYVDDVKAK